jgi:hypothetical protein
MPEVSDLKNNADAVSGSLHDKVAPSEADLAQRLEASNQAGSRQAAGTSSAAKSSYMESLTRGMETPADAE